MANKQNQADIEAARYAAMEQALAPQCRTTHVLLLILCGTMVLSLGLLLCFLPKQHFSPEENRMLQGVPEFSIPSLLDGTLTGEIGTFCSDQFPFRSSFVALKAASELALGKQQNNGVLYGVDGYLIPRYEYTIEQKSNIEKNVSYVARFAKAMEQADIPFTFVVVPRSSDVNTPYLPSLYSTDNSLAAWRWLQEAALTHDLTYLSLLDPLLVAAEHGEAVWYKTDHHWTARGAYEAYAALGGQLGYVPYAWEDFSEQVAVKGDFYGTAYASSGMRWVAGDTVMLPRYSGDDAIQVEILENGIVVRTISGLYDTSALNTHDKYSVFLGGTNTHIRVTSTAQTKRPMLVLLKDSYAQSLSPYLSRHFDLLLIDPRTHKSASGAIIDMIHEHGADQVVLLYGLDTLAQSASLRILTFGLAP